MSLTPTDDGCDADPGDDDRPAVPEGVLRGIDDIAEGETASKDDIDAVLKD
jgi:hypothetical protein